MSPGKREEQGLSERTNDPTIIRPPHSDFVGQRVRSERSITCRARLTKRPAQPIRSAPDPDHRAHRTAALDWIHHSLHALDVYGVVVGARTTAACPDGPPTGSSLRQAACAASNAGEARLMPVPPRLIPRWAGGPGTPSRDGSACVPRRPGRTARATRRSARGRTSRKRRSRPRR